MLLSAVDKITVTATTDGSQNTYALPISFISIEKVDYASEGETVYTPLFTDYIMVGNTFSIPGTYAGGFEIYYKYNGPDQWTLDKLLTECIMLVDNTKIIKTNGDYIGTSLQEVRKIITALNRAKNKIAREKFKPSYSESIVLGTNGTYDTESTTKLFIQIDSLTDANDNNIPYKWTATDTFKTNLASGEVLTLTYSFMPSDLVYLTDVLDFPERIDPRVLCYFGAYQYYLINAPDLADTWLSLWQDGFDSIYSRNIFKPIKSSY